jgi:hypothetical protein
MKLQIFEYRCAPFGHEFHAPELPTGTYGEFLLRDEAGAFMAHLDALADPTYKEVDALLAGLPGIIQVKASKRAEILRQIYGLVACDPTPDGKPFQIGLHPRCPTCSSHAMRSWQEVQPAQFADYAVPSVTHSLWLSLTEEQKITRVNRYVLMLDARGR